MSASFLSPPKTTAEDVTGPCGTLRPYEPLVWDGTAVLVIAWESVTAVDPHTHTTPGLEAIDTRGGRGGHNPYIYLAPEPPRNTVLQPWMWHFRGNAGSNCPSPSPNKLLHLMLDIKAALHSHRKLLRQAQKGRPITGLLGDVSGPELKRKVRQQLASVSAALSYQRHDWECKEGEVNPACKKTVCVSRARAPHTLCSWESIRHMRRVWSRDHVTSW